MRVVPIIRASPVTRLSLRQGKPFLYVWNEVNFSSRALYYITDPAWDGYVELVTSDKKYPRTVVTFEEFLAAQGK